MTTFSLHCEANLFSKREYSDLDVDLRPGAGDDEYLDAMEAHLPSLFERVAPDLVFFQAGVDAHTSDRFGKLNLSSAGLKRRNKMVVRSMLALSLRVRSSHASAPARRTCTFLRRHATHWHAQARATGPGD